MGEWKPIETAPKDGSAIILCQLPHDWVGIGKWVTDDGPEWLLESGFRVWATHWLPIPSLPPSPAEADK